MFTAIAQLPTHEKISIIDGLIDELQRAFTHKVDNPIVKKQLTIAQKFRMRIIKSATIS